MAKVYYKGPGITTLGVNFENGSYELSDKASTYVLETFPENFSRDEVVVTPLNEVVVAPLNEVVVTPKQKSKKN